MMVSMLVEKVDACDHARVSVDVLFGLGLARKKNPVLEVCLR